MRRERGYVLKILARKFLSNTQLMIQKEFEIE